MRYLFAVILVALPEIIMEVDGMSPEFGPWNRNTKQGVPSTSMFVAGRVRISKQ